MSWFYRSNAVRAVELNTIAYMVWQRRSKNPWTRLEVQLADPQDKRSPYIVLCQGHASQPMKANQVQKYIRDFYDNLSCNGSNAPNDVFLDSMNNVTQGRR